MTATPGPRVGVVGGGIIGLAVAWCLTERGATVTLVDPDRSRAAARVAAGMLAPVTEANFGEEELLALNLASARRWSGFAAGLATASGHDPGFVACGTLAVARDADDMALLDQLAGYLDEVGQPVERLTSRALRRRERALAPTVRGGLAVAGDHQVDPRRCLDALVAALERAGAAMIDDEAVAVAAGRIELAAGRTLVVDEVVVCAGWASGRLLGLPVRPVKGQLLRLGRTERALLPGHVLRGRDVYLASRPWGEVVVGATTEERGPDVAISAGPLRQLLRDAWELVPGVDEAALLETSAGLRPGTPDNGPLIGTRPDGVHVATGHYRNGVLLAPVTAAAVTAAVCDGAWPAEVAPFHLDRFEQRGAA